MNIWVYWENLNGGETPDHIKLCLETIEKYSGKATLKVLNEKSPEVVDILKGGFPKTELALKADVIRANLLDRFGGICVDADVVVLRDLSSLLDLLVEGKTFVGFEDEKYHARLGIMASLPGSSIVSDWVRLQRERIVASAALHWTALGCDQLWKATPKYPDQYVGVDMDLFYPIPWTSSDVFFTNENLSSYRDDLYGVQLFGKMTFERLVKMDREGILSSNYLFSKFFRKSLLS